MKKIIIPSMVIVVLPAFLFAACKKTDTVLIETASIITAPVANAGKDTTITLPFDGILLDGSGSTDKENTIAKYQWRLISNLSPSFVTIAKPDSAKTMVENLLKGTYHFELTVRDISGISDKDTVAVIVLVPKSLNVKAFPDTVITLPYNRAVLALTGNTFGDNVVANWKKISGPDSFSIAGRVVSNLIEGVYQFEVTATNSFQTTVKDTMAVTVLPDANLYTSEKLFENLHSVCGKSSCSITLNNIASTMPTGHPFLVYLKPDLNADWQILIDSRKNYYYLFHEYLLNDNAIEIKTYTFNGWEDMDMNIYFQNINSAIKIVY
jgi:hypothetical protein